MHQRIAGAAKRAIAPNQRALLPLFTTSVFGPRSQARRRTQARRSRLARLSSSGKQQHIPWRMTSMRSPRINLIHSSMVSSAVNFTSGGAPAGARGLRCLEVARKQIGRYSLARRVEIRRRHPVQCRACRARSYQVVVGAQRNVLPAEWKPAVSMPRAELVNVAPWKILADHRDHIRGRGGAPRARKGDSAASVLHLPNSVHRVERDRANHQYSPRILHGALSGAPLRSGPINSASAHRTVGDATSVTIAAM